MCDRAAVIEQRIDENEYRARRDSFADVTFFEETLCLHPCAPRL